MTLKITQSDCACDICSAAGCDVITETDQSFLSAFPRPVTLGHLVVASKRHVSDISDLEDEETRDIGKMCKVGVGILKKVLGVKKVYIVAIGDRDSHFHFHLLPRHAGEEKLGRYVFGGASAFANRPKPESDDVQRIIMQLKNGYSAANESFKE